MLFRFLFLVLFLFSLLPNAAQAQEYAEATWPNLLHTMIRFNALDLSDTALLDEYGIVTECKLYDAFYKNDFKWQQVRQAMQDSIKLHFTSFPTAYHYDLKVQLDRYDFAAKLFRFADKSQIDNVNTFVLYAVEGTGCGIEDVKYLPRVFRAVLQTPFSLEGIPLAEADAKALLSRMNQAENTPRLVYARFNLHIVYVAPVRKILDDSRGKSGLRYSQLDVLGHETVRLDVRLDSVAFYEDPEMTKLIFQY